MDRHVALRLSMNRLVIANAARQSMPPVGTDLR